MRNLGLFPGQGSQKVGMGRELFERSELAQALFRQADEVLGFSLSRICFEGPPERLTATEVAQPAILTVSTICWRLAEERGVNLTAAAGHSLGEYTALVAAGALSFEDAVLLVHKRGKYMQAAVPVGAGKMVAVIGKEVTEIEAALATVTGGVAQIANINSPGQIVVAGDAGSIDHFVAALPGARTTELPVSAPFHCALMKPAADQLAGDLDRVTIHHCRFPVYANTLARGVTEASEVRQALKDQVCGRVRWVECMENALRDHQIEQAIEFGAGNVLSNLLKRIQSSIPRATAGSVEEVAALPG